MRRRTARVLWWTAIAAVALAGCTPGARGNPRTVVGTVERIDPSSRTLSVRDGAGTLWSFRVDADAGIDLRPYRPGDPVSVTLARSTPLNMVAAADRLRKGDTLRKSAAATGYPANRGPANRASPP